MQLTLHGYWSTNPQKVRLALEESALAYDYIAVDLAAGEHRTTAFTQLNPMGPVPKS